MTKRLNFLTRKHGDIDGLVAVETWIANSFDPKLLDLVKLRVSQMNGCAYCLHMHRKHAIKRGETEDRLLLLDAWREAELYTERERAALAWAEANPDLGEPRIRRRLRESAEHLLRRRTPRALDRDRYHQRLEQVGDRLSPATSGGPRARRRLRHIRLAQAPLRSSSGSEAGDADRPLTALLSHGGLIGSAKLERRLLRNSPVRDPSKVESRQCRASFAALLPLSSSPSRR
jgi:AhpD family alkylhydroperoxidase